MPRTIPDPSRTATTLTRQLGTAARTAGLLGERQRVTDSKKFKAAKKVLGVISRRDGFGRGGEWFWELPTTSRTKAVEIAADTVQSVPMELAIYADLRQDLYAFVCKGDLRGVFASGELSYGRLAHLAGDVLEP
jgi:hypothetical protein